VKTTSIFLHFYIVPINLDLLPFNVKLVRVQGYFSTKFEV